MVQQDINYKNIKSYVTTCARCAGSGFKMHFLVFKVECSDCHGLGKIIDRVALSDE